MKRKRPDTKHVSARQIDAAGSFMAGAYGVKTDKQREVDLTAAVNLARKATLKDPWKVKHASEAKVQGAVTDWARHQWWRDGYRHHPQERRGWDGVRMWQRGQQAGYPDVTVLLPPQAFALELKSERERPAAALEPEWWLAWVRDIGWHPATAVKDIKHYGLRASQAWTLLEMHEVGYRTMVAYGADEAIAWLDQVCGRLPRRCRKGGEYPTKPREFDGIPRNPLTR